MTRLHVANCLKRQRATGDIGHGSVHFQEVSHVVASVEAAEDRSGDPSTSAAQNRRVLWAFLPLASRELVHLIARLFTEKGRKVVISFMKEVHH